MELVSISSEVLELRNAYLKAKILDKKSQNDATHVAAATLPKRNAF